jgi:hypothetical protein
VVLDPHPHVPWDLVEADRGGVGERRVDVALPEVGRLHHVQVAVGQDVLPERVGHARESNIGVMSALPPYVRTTGFANWNRYAAVNDEFIDIHMDPDAARAVGMPDAFGMGNLRIAYLHNLLHDWLDGSGDIVELRCELRGLNFKGDELTCHGTLAGERTVDGHDLVDVALGVRNQDGAETTPGSATLVRFRGAAAMPPLPAPTGASGAAEPGTFLDAATIDKVGRVLPQCRPRRSAPTTSPAGPSPPTGPSVRRRRSSTRPSPSRGRGGVSWPLGTSIRSPGCRTGRGRATGCGAWAPSRASGC